MKKTEWRGQECPPEYVKYRNAGHSQIIIYTDVRQETGEDGEMSYVATRIIMPIGVLDYGRIVSAIIDAHYSNDQMQAIVNNHLIGEHTEEFEAMQAYRVYAKDMARRIVNSLNTESEVQNGKE